MKIKFLQAISGENLNHVPGDIVEHENEEALRFLSAGIAEAVVEPQPERATRTKK